MTSRLNVPLLYPDEAEHRRLIAQAVNQILLGRLNNTGTVTLEANEASTAVADRRVGVDSIIILTPISVSAGTEAGSGNLYISAVTAEQFTITHTNSATADREFGYAVFG